MGFRTTKTQFNIGDGSNKAIIENSDDKLVEQTINYAISKGICVKPVDVDKIAEELGANIIKKKLDAGIAGRVEVKADGTCKIYVDKDMHPHRQRFTVAHEIGHYLKHGYWQQESLTDGDVPGFLSHNRDESQGGKEWEANVFAAQLLMPKSALLERLQQGVEIKELAREFNVSYTAMKIRVEHLGVN